MDNLISETNARLQAIINDLSTIRNEYEANLEKNRKEINEELEKVREYKEEFSSSKAKIDKMNQDILEFEEDYQHLVTRFKDDEFANILVTANKEISQKIDERKAKIVNDKNEMNVLVEKAEKVKKKLVRLNAENKSYDECLNKINDAYNYYSKAIGEMISYANENEGHLYINNKDTNYETTQISETELINQEANDNIEFITSESTSDIEDTNNVDDDTFFSEKDPSIGEPINTSVIEEIDIDNDPDFSFEFIEDDFNANKNIEDNIIDATAENVKEESFFPVEDTIEIKDDQSMPVSEDTDEFIIDNNIFENTAFDDEIEDEEQ